MARQTIEIVGGRRLGRKLRQLPDEIRDRILVEATDAGAVIFEAEARRSAPRRSGELSRAIDRRQSRSLGDRHRVVFEVGVSLTVSSSRKPGYYGVMLERGTRERVRKGGGRTGRVRARWWLRRAFRNAKAKAGTRISRRIETKAARIRLPTV